MDGSCGACPAPPLCGLMIVSAIGQCCLGPGSGVYVKVRLVA